jgi:hypothetical protein
VEGFLRVRRNTGVRVNIEWALGKTTPLLKQVDRSAKTAAGTPGRKDHGFREGKVGRSVNAVGGVARLFPAGSGQEALIRVYQSTAYPSGENKIKFQIFSTEKGGFYDKYFACADPHVGFLLHRGHEYRVKFNPDSRYPQIIEVTEEPRE